MSVTTAATAASTDPAPRRTAPRLLRGRMSGAHVLIVGAGLIAAAANWAVLAADELTLTVLVAAEDIGAGQRITAADLVAQEVAGAGPALERLLAELPAAEMVAVTRVAAGDPVRASDVTLPAAADPALRRMSLPVPAEHAAGGAIIVGDRVDVLAAADDHTRTVVSGVEVVAVADREDRGFGALGAFHVTVLVTAAEAICLVEALADGEIHVVVATGAVRRVSAPCSRP